MTIKINIESDVDIACKRERTSRRLSSFLYKFSFYLGKCTFSLHHSISFVSIFFHLLSFHPSTSSSYSLLHPYFFIFLLQHTFSYVAALTRKTSFLLFSSLMEKHFNLKASLLHPSYKYIRILHLNVIIFQLSLTHLLALSLSHSCC